MEELDKQLQSKTEQIDQILFSLGLSEMKQEVLDTFSDLRLGKIDISQIFARFVGKGNINIGNVGDSVKSFREIEVLLPENDPQPSTLDVSAHFVVQDELFHELLNYIKSLKVSSEIEKRIFNIFISIIKGLRDDFEAKEVLSKKEIDGGCAMNEVQANEVFSNLKQTVEKIREYDFANDVVINWFRDHYQTLMTQRLNDSEFKDLQIDSHKEEAAGQHRMETLGLSSEKTIAELLINPKHDLNMPLGEHIKFHFDQIKSEPELPAAPVQKEVTTPAPLKKIPVKTSPDKVIPAPLPSRVSVKPLETKNTDEMLSVAKKPVMSAPTSGDILPQRVMPPKLKQMVDQTTAPEGIDLVKEAIAKGVKKPSFFSRVFGRKKNMPSAPQSSISPMMKSETINAIPNIKGRPQVTDITFTPHLVTPVDELQSLTLQDFRRLSKDPMTAIKKISDKLELLSQESLRKKSDGIEALKKSALYNDYSAIMSESVMKGIPYNQVIMEKKTLTEAEYQSLMQLNKLLRS